MRSSRIALLLAVLATIILSACATQKVLCEPPNSVINNACCLDTNKNNVCDNKEEIAPPAIEETEATEQAQTTKETRDPRGFAGEFATAWKTNQFSRMYGLFTIDYRDAFSEEEFVWLSERQDAALKINDVKVFRVSTDTIEYDLIAEDPSIKNSAKGAIVWESGAYKHRPFNYFKTLSVTTVCGKDSSCIVEYAKTFKKQDACDLAGPLRVSCRQAFGVKYTFDDERAICNEIPNYFDKADCIQNMSVKYGRTDACWDLAEDPQLFRCLGHIAGLSRNTQLCWDYMKNFTFVNDATKHAHCITGYVQQTKDHSVCSQMKAKDNVIIGSMLEECYGL